MHLIRNRHFLHAGAAAMALGLLLLAAAPVRAAYFFYDDWAGRVSAVDPSAAIMK